MRTLPNELTRIVEAWSGEEQVSDGRYRAYWCDECQRYSVWPGPDWGASHYFCDACLEKLELATPDKPQSYQSNTKQT